MIYWEISEPFCSMSTQKRQKSIAAKTSSIWTQERKLLLATSNILLAQASEKPGNTANKIQVCHQLCHFRSLLVKKTLWKYLKSLGLSHLRTPLRKAMNILEWTLRTLRRETLGSAPSLFWVHYMRKQTCAMRDRRGSAEPPYSSSLGISNRPRAFGIFTY